MKYGLVSKRFCQGHRHPRPEATEVVTDHLPTVSVHSKNASCDCIHNSVAVVSIRFVDDGPIPNPPETAGRPEPSSYPLDSAVIELAVMMANTYRATLKNCHYIQMLVQNFVGVAAGHGEVYSSINS